MTPPTVSSKPNHDFTEANFAVVRVDILIILKIIIKDYLLLTPSSAMLTVSCEHCA